MPYAFVFHANNRSYIMQTGVYIKHIKLRLMKKKVTATLRSSLNDNFEFQLIVVVYPYTVPLIYFPFIIYIGYA